MRPNRPRSGHGHNENRPEIGQDLVRASPTLLYGTSDKPQRARDPSHSPVVIVRVRPLNRSGRESADESLRISSKTVCLDNQTFTFDAVAGPEATQESIFDIIGLPMVENCIAGTNSSIFAYGQTGSGKTYTMWGAIGDSPGPRESRGIAPRVFEKLFARIEEEETKNVQLRHRCTCSFVELYGEQITDLLGNSHKNLQIRGNGKTLYVENLTQQNVSSVDDVRVLLLKGLANRRVGSTMMNSQSSRSHCIFTFVVESKNSAQGDSFVTRTSKLNLVDLAGSERQKQSRAAGERLKEAGYINRSLSQLGNVISILAEVAEGGKQRHIPYRNSRLTFLLQESLGGNSKVAMVCTISTASSSRSETSSTLKFARRVKAVQNAVIVNEEKSSDVTLLREQIRQLKEELLLVRLNTREEAATGADMTFPSVEPQALGTESHKVVAGPIAVIDDACTSSTDSCENFKISVSSVDRDVLALTPPSTAVPARNDKCKPNLPWPPVIVLADSPEPEGQPGSSARNPIDLTEPWW